MSPFCSLLLPVVAALLLSSAAVTQADDKTSSVATPPAAKTLAELEKNIDECGDDSVEKLFQQLCDAADVHETETVAAAAASRKRRSAEGYGSYGGGYPDFGRGYASYGNGYNLGYGRGSSGYNRNYGSYANGDYSNGYESKVYLDYDRSSTDFPVLSFVKGFKPGKSYVEQGKIVRNYYRHGTYEVALQHYKLIPVIKVVPYTTYKTVSYTDHVTATNAYSAKICQDCYHGYPKIDLVSNKEPYNYVTRRFIYLPENYQIDGYETGQLYYGGAFAEGKASWGVPDQGKNSWGGIDEGKSSWGVPDQGKNSWGGFDEEKASWGVPDHGKNPWGGFGGSKGGSGYPGGQSYGGSYKQYGGSYGYGANQGQPPVQLPLP